MKVLKIQEIKKEPLMGNRVCDTTKHLEVSFFVRYNRCAISGIEIGSKNSLIITTKSLILKRKWIVFCESPSLRQEHKCKKGHPRVAFLHLFPGGEKQSPCGLCAGDSKGFPCRGSPLRIVRLPPQRGGAPKAPRGAPEKFPQALSSHQCPNVGTDAEG